MTEKFRSVVLAVIFKMTNQGIRIMTQMRKVQDLSYDPLYNNTWEGMGETLEPRENFIQSLLRGCREEFGLPDFTPIRIIGDEETIWTSNRGDAFLCYRPLCFIQSLGIPHSWIGPAFAVEVASDFQPHYEAGDKEATRCRWWAPSELLKATEENPRDFMGLHRPALHLFCQLVLKGEIS